MLCEVLQPYLALSGRIVGTFPDVAEFKKEFRESLIDNVQRAVEAAKEKARRLPPRSGKINWIDIRYFEQELINCPVCDGPGILNGTTERLTWIKRGEQDIDEPGLWFVPDAFQCRACGLTL